MPKKIPLPTLSLNDVPLRFGNINSWMLATGKLSVYKVKKKRILSQNIFSSHSVTVWCLIDGTRKVKDIVKLVSPRIDEREAVLILTLFMNLKLIKKKRPGIKPGL